MMAEHEPDDLIGCPEAAQIAGVHHRTIISWIRAGYLPAMKRPGSKGRYLIRFQDLQDLAFKEFDHADEATKFHHDTGTL